MSVILSTYVWTIFEIHVKILSFIFLKFGYQIGETALKADFSSQIGIRA
jgi:hypothetical protein